MSNLTSIAMQNRDAEAMRKKMRKAEMEEALLSGGVSSGGSASSESSQVEDSIDTGSINNALMAPAVSGGGIGSVLGDVAGELVQAKVRDTVADGVEKLAQRSAPMLKEMGEQVFKKIGKEALGEAVEFGAKRLLGKAIGFLANPWVGAVLLANDIVEIVTGKSILAHARDALFGEKEEDSQGNPYWKVEEDSLKKKEADLIKKRAEEAERRMEMAELARKKKEAEEQAKKEAEEKARAEEEAQRLARANQEAEEEEEEDDEENEDEDEQFDSAIKKGLKKGLLSTALTFGGSMGIALSMVGMYRIHYSGEFEFKGIGAEYQGYNIDFENFKGYDKNGDVQLLGLSKENKMIKTFYTKYSDKSYYAIVEDSSKYKNMDDAYKKENLLTPDEMREQYPEIEDVNKREAMFQLNPDVLYVLDKYLHDDAVLYPQQFIKPVYYEESQDKFELKDLVDTSGDIVAKSQAFNSDGTPTRINGQLKKEPGVWDYGFAPVLRYQEHEVRQKKITNPIKAEIFDTNGNPVTDVDGVAVESRIDDLGLRDKPAYIIDKAVTPGGTVENKIKTSWVKDPSSVKTYDRTMNVPVTIDNPDKNPAKCNAIADEISKNSCIVSENNKPDKIQVNYTQKVTFEEYIEEELPQYDGDPSTEKITGSKYFRDYIGNYTNYIPVNLPSKFDFRVLDNEEVKKLIYDDDPNNPMAGGGTGSQGNETIVGQTFKAEFTAYYPANDSMQGGLNDAMGNPLDPSKNTCAGPIKRKYPNSLLEFNSRIQIKGTGTSKDGTVCTITDTGGAIVLKPDGTYRIDILMANKTEAYAFGRRKGEIVIEAKSTPVATRNVERTAESMMNNYYSVTNRSASLIVNTGGNAVTNYGIDIDEYAKKRYALAVKNGCEGGCSLGEYRQNLEPHAYKETVGDLRHLRLDIYRPVNEEVFKQMFREKFSSIGEYGGSLIEAGKQKGVDVVAKSAQLAQESGWGKRAIIGTSGGKKYYNFAGIGAVDGNAYNGGLQYAIEHGWDTPEKGMLGAIEFLADNYIYSPEYKQNTWYKISLPPSVSHFYASDPDYAYAITSIMQSSIIRKYPNIYAQNASFYFDFPEFDPNKPPGTIEGAGYVPGGGVASGGGGTPNTAFNSYLATNWSGIETVWDEMFPNQKELDEKLSVVTKGEYSKLEADTSKALPRGVNRFDGSLKNIDTNIALSMMFALNQGNYLFKYDDMGEAEWKAMYTQLLSSPTGSTWDDKWIGFSKTDIFGTEDVGKLFEEGSGVNPVISVEYGKVKNTLGDDITLSSQYSTTNFGIDVVVPPDTEVLTVADGEVISVSKSNDYDSRYANYVQIRHAKGTVTTTANLKKVKVKVGQKVKKGDVIGTSGGEGRAYKDNALHYSIKHKNEYINPTWIITGSMTGFEDPISGNNGGVNCGGTSGAVTNNSLIAKVIEIAKAQLGKPYVWGATGPSSFDCSGFMYYIMREAGVEGGRLTAQGYYEKSTPVAREQIQAGDFVFWRDTGGSKHSEIYHVGLYIGNDTVIDCSTDNGKGVQERKFSDLKDSGSREFKVGRYTPLSGGGSPSTGGVVSGGSSSGCQTPGGGMDSGNYIWPVPSSNRITAQFGEWRDGGSRQHKGLDIGASIGSPVVASRDGKVIKVNDSCPTTGYYGNPCGGQFGNYVYLEHADGMVTIYPHMAKGSVKVKLGDTVKQGQEVGGIGSSGSSTGAHLHFEMRVGGSEKVNPLDYVKAP